MAEDRVQSRLVELTVVIDPATQHGIPIVTSVIPDGPADRAGLRNQRDIARPVLMGVFIAGGLVFPPAFFGAAVVASSSLGESHDTIVAVDSERTRDVQELEDAISRSRDGPILYLSLIRGGRRTQIQVFVHAENDEIEQRVQNSGPITNAVRQN
jgi:S1-C subfamily serine protease